MEKIKINIEQNIEKSPEKIKEFVLILIKPLGMQSKIRGLIDDELFKYGDVIYRRSVATTKEIVAEHYLQSQYDKDGKPIPYYPTIVNYMSNKITDVFILDEKESRGKDDRSFIKKLREDVIGNTRPDKAKEGTIRKLAVEHDLPFMQYPQMSHDEIIEGINYCTDNLIHCSDSPDSALREIKIWFKDQPEVIEKYEKLYEQIKR